MKMAADSNMSFHHGIFTSSFYNQNMVSLQSGGLNGGMGVIPGEMNSSRGINRTAGMIMAGNPSMMSGSSSAIMAGSSSGNTLLDPVPGLKHDTGLTMDWSLKEMAILKDGLIKYANEPSMMKYIKIAATLPDKNVRDVALRCRWMVKENNKRRKIEENSAGKKIKDKKDKIVDSSSNTNLYPAPLNNMAAYSFMMPQANQNNQFPFEVRVIDGVTQQRMDENTQVLGQINANLATFKVQENIDLFCRTRNNFVAIINSMSEMPGIMSQMPPLPVSVDEDLVNTIFPSSSQPLVFGAPSGNHPKQEPRF